MTSKIVYLFIELFSVPAYQETIFGLSSLCHRVPTVILSQLEKKTVTCVVGYYGRRNSQGFLNCYACVMNDP